MKKIILILSVFCASTAYAAPVTFPMNFESAPVTGDFTDFDGAGVTVVPNPQIGGINTSATVGQAIRNGGQIWAGSYVTLASAYNPATFGGISMMVYTTAPIGTVIKLKMEGGTNYEMNAVTKTTGAWEVLKYNFKNAPATNTQFDFMFDYGKVGDGTATSTFLFDNVTEITATPYAPFNLDFESAYKLNSDFNDFDGAGVTVMANPQSGGINTSATVVELIRNGGQVWAGSKLVLSNTLDFSTNGYIIMKVYTTAPIGTKVTFKLEGNGVAEVDAFTTVTGAWETLKWNYTGQPANFNEFVFLFDLGNLGDGTATSTFLFDDVAQSADGIVAAGPPTVGPTTGIFASANNAKTTYSIAPNPTKDSWLISNEHSVINSIVVMDVLGNEMMTLSPNVHTANIDALGFESGVYIAKVSFNGATSLIRLIKE